MTEKVEFTVPGVATTQGSMRAVTNRHTGRAVVIHEKPQKLRSWRNDIQALYLDTAKDRPPHGGPVTVYLSFDLPRPKAHYGTGRNSETLKPSAPLLHTSKPDLDKLVRAVLDALTGVAWRDDSQVCLVNARKWYGTVPQLHVRLLFDAS